MRSQLASLDGAAFDHAYMRGQVVEHQKIAQLLQWRWATVSKPRCSALPPGRCRLSLITSAM